MTRSADFNRIFFHPWSMSFVYNKETNCRRKSKPQQITMGFTWFRLKRPLCSIRFLIIPATRSKATAILLTALKAKIKLTKKAR
jgi:hypothetical protein